MDASQIDLLSRIAHAIALQFGQSCEVVVHDLENNDPEHSIVCIENGQVSGRSVGDGASRIVLDALAAGPEGLEDRLCYLTRTSDGKLLKSSSVFVRDDDGKVIGVFGINYDVTVLRAANEQLAALAGDPNSDKPREQGAETISRTVSELLDELIDQSVRLVGVPVELMTRDDKIRAIRYLDDAGAFLVKRSGPKVCEFFGISKYTLYSYLDRSKPEDSANSAKSDDSSAA